METNTIVWSQSVELLSDLEAMEIRQTAENNICWLPIGHSSLGHAEVGAFFCHETLSEGPTKGLWMQM